MSTTISASSTVLATGATTPVALGDLVARALYVDDFGALGDSRTDDGPAFQSAINALGSLGGTIHMAAKRYRIATPVIISLANVTLVGQGYYEEFGPGCGTWILIDQTGFTPFTISGGHAIGTILRDFGVYQTQPIPSATPGTPWSPTPYNYVFSFSNMNGGFIIDNVFLANITQGVSINGCGHFEIRKLTGQCYQNGVTIDNCYDQPRLEYLRFWPYQSNNINVLTYQQANFDALTLGRCDGAFIGDIFAYAARAVIHGVQGANGPPQFTFNNLSGDRVAYGLWLDGLSNNGTIILIQGSNMYTNNVSVGNGGVPVAQGWAIYANVNNFVDLQIANVYITYSMNSAIEWLGSANTLSIANLTANSYNFSQTNQPAIAVGACPLADWSNMVLIGTARLINGHGGLVTGTAGNAVAVHGNCIYDNRPVNVLPLPLVLSH